MWQWHRFRIRQGYCLLLLPAAAMSISSSSLLGKHSVARLLPSSGMAWRSVSIGVPTRAENSPGGGLGEARKYWQGYS